MIHRNSWAVAFIALCACASDHDRAPYVQRVGAREATLVWRTLKGSDTVARFGTSSDALVNEVASADRTVRHEVRLTGLEPNTRYYYAVGSSDAPPAADARQFFFETAPLPGTRRRFRAWVLGDSGSGDRHPIAVRNAMWNFVGPEHLAMFLHLGDIAYESGTATELTNHFFAPFQRVTANVPVWPAFGNHEARESDAGDGSGPFFDAFVLPRAAEAGGAPSGSEAYYAFDYGNVHFVVLDSSESPRDPNGAMLTWLRRDLAESPREWLIAMWHHPPYSKSNHDSDVEAELVDMRTHAVPILEAAGVDLVLSGHSHGYERSCLVSGAYDTPTTAAGHIVDARDGDALGPYRKERGTSARGTVYVVAGHGGRELADVGQHPLMCRSESAHGSLILDVDGDRLTVQNLRDDGQVTDRFTIVKESAK
jgi:hypothetical protein